MWVYLNFPTCPLANTKSKLPCRAFNLASQIISCSHCSAILRYPFACNVGARPHASRSGRFSARHSSSQSKAEWERYVLDGQAAKSISNLNLGPKSVFEMRLTALTLILRLQQ